MSTILFSFLCSLLGSGYAVICNQYGNWGSWSACPKSCGGAFRIRHCYADGNTETERCGAVCYNGAEFYGGQCHCRHGTVPPCCTDILECASNPCLNGGRCIEGINSYTCDCPAGTTGTNCIDISECASNPCKNGGICQEHINYYTCTCPTGTTGPNCDDILECESNPCLNGGTCIEHIGGYSCQCLPGTTDYNCIDIPECASNPCQNGGTCVEMINRYDCTCPRNFAGDNCQKDLFSSSDSTCRTNGDQACYVVFKVKDTWQGAKEFCEARHGHLAVPDNSDEEQFLETYLISMRVRFTETMFWIGGTKSGSSSPRWVTGSDTRVTRWPPGMGDHTIGDKCIAMDGAFNFLWQTQDCNRPSFFICEERTPFTVSVG